MKIKKCRCKYCFVTPGWDGTRMVKMYNMELCWDCWSVGRDLETNDEYEDRETIE